MYSKPATAKNNCTCAKRNLIVAKLLSNALMEISHILNTAIIFVLKYTFSKRLNSMLKTDI